jgi:hypothetical protein
MKSATNDNIFAELTMETGERYDGNNRRAEPESVGSGADAAYCRYSAAM